MALPRFHRLPEERRRRLIASAAEEFASRGFKGAALSAIAEKSGMGKASVYYYFADKADLYATVLEEAWARLRSETRLELEALDAKNFWPELERVTRMNLELCRQEPWLLDAALLLNRASPDPANEAVLDEYLERRQEWEAVFIARGQELGAVRSDVPTDLLASMSLSVRQSSNLWILERAKELSADECDTMALQVFGIYRGILSPPTRV